MTFSDLMKVLYRGQKVAVIIGEGAIVGEAEDLDCYLTNEVTNAQVKEVNVADNGLKVWIEE